MKFLVTLIAILTGYLASVRKYKRIDWQIRGLERPSMTRASAFLRSLIFGVFFYVVTFLILSALLDAAGISTSD